MSTAKEAKKEEKSHACLFANNSSPPFRMFTPSPKACLPSYTSIKKAAARCFLLSSTYMTMCVLGFDFFFLSNHLLKRY